MYPQWTLQPDYTIDLEELFVFFVTRFKKESSISDLVNGIFGGDHGRWKYVFLGLDVKLLTWTGGTRPSLAIKV